MQPSIYAITFSLISMLSFGASLVLQKFLLNYYSSTKLIVYKNIFVVLIILFFGLFTKDINLNQSSLTILATIFVSLLGYLGIYFLNISLSKGKVGVVIPIASSRVVITSLISIIILNEYFKFSHLISIVFVLFGVIISSVNISDFKKFNTNRESLFYAILTAVFLGISFAYFGMLSSSLGVITFTFIQEFTVLIASIIHTLILKQSIDLGTLFKSKSILYLLSLVFIGLLGSFTLNFAYSTGYVSIVTAISSASLIIASFLAWFFLKEKIMPKNIFSMLLIFVGIIIFVIF